MFLHAIILFQATFVICLASPNREKKGGQMTYLGLCGGHFFPGVLSFVKDYSRQNTKAFQSINFDLARYT